VSPDGCMLVVSVAVMAVVGFAAIAAFFVICTGKLPPL
jgi:hypothetical protein